MNSHNTSKNSTQAAEIDEGLYSRQIYVLGKEAMTKMAISNVLVCGLDGLGLEVAKNIILAGVKKLTLFDNRKVSVLDYASCYYLKESDLTSKQSLAKLMEPQLAELNPYVDVNVIDNASDSFTLLPALSDISIYQVVVLCNLGCADPKFVNWVDVARKQCKIVLVQSRGIFGQIFVDFGDEFVVQDKTGEEPLHVLVQAIEQSELGQVTCLEETRHGFEDGDYVKFSEVLGMKELNSSEPRCVKVIGPETFSIGNTSMYSPYISGGICTQVKKPFSMKFKPLGESLKQPEIMTTDFAKLEAPQSCHISFQSIDLNGGFEGIKSSWDQSGANSFIKSTEKLIKNGTIIGDVASFDAALTGLFYLTARSSIISVHSVMGGIAAQEVIKALSHRFTPIYQWLYFDCREVLPENPIKLDENKTIIESALKKEDVSMDDETNIENLRNLRYKAQVALIGKDIQKKISNSRIFIVGAGAIGCELIKNFSMMGLGTGPEGNIFLTDMDRIERSNLNRQFLFHNEHIGELKSKTAAASAICMNPHLNIEAHEFKVGQETENFYTDDFFENLNLVATALDNVDARTYIDRRCVFYHKPLLESGTMGTKGNVQVVVPFLTESYSSSQDPPEKSFLLCTLKSFPYEIAHTLQWARDAFHTFFYETGVTAQNYLMDPKGFVEKVIKLQGNKLYETFDTLNKSLIIQRPKNFQDCVQWAREKFQHFYSNEIKQLLYNFPPDQKASNGTPFWSGTKRCPHPIEFDPSNSTHFDFIFSSANLLAFLYGIAQCRDHKEVMKALQKCKVPEFVPKSGVKISTTENEANQMQDNAFQMDETHIEKIISELEDLKHSLVDLCVTPIEFEKDDDTNLHMEFITSCSNLRASNYNIEQADKLKSKLIAGKIIPAIATTTGIVAGLVGIEFLKLMQSHKNVEMYKNGYLNLALPFFAFSEPIAPTKLSYFDTEFTIWNRFEIQEDLTLEAFIDYFKKKHNLTIIMISQGLAMLYSFFISKQTREQRMKTRITDLVEQVSKKTIPFHVKSLVLEICCNDNDGNDVEVPYVKYHITSKK